MSHRQVAVLTIALSMALSVVSGFAYAAAEHIAIWHGIYCTWMTALTVGGDVAPTGWGRLVLSVAATLIIPLLGATFSLFTSGLTEIHISKAEHRIKKHVTDQIGGGSGD